MRHPVAGLLFFLFVFAWGEVRSAPITYQLTFDAGGGNTLAGTVTTDGVIGSVAPSDITGWSFSASGIASFGISSADSGAQMFCSAECFTSTSTELSFDFANDDTTFTVPPVPPFVRFLSSLSLVDWNDAGSGYAFEHFPQSIVVVGIASPEGGTVPEPAVMALLGVALAAGVARKRVRGQRSTAV